MLDDLKELSMFGVLKYRETFPNVTPQGGGEPCGFFALSFVRRDIAVAEADDKRVPADYAPYAPRRTVFGQGRGRS